MYYLQSRYYAPALGRFISADDSANMGANGHILSHNLFAYCENNPVNRTDETGNVSWKSTAKFGLAVMAVGILMLATVATGGGALGLASGGVAVLTAVANTTVAAGTAITIGSLISAATKPPNKRTSANQMQEQVKNNQAPKEVKRVDKGNPDIPGNKDHVHFEDQTALNFDGTPSHDGRGVPRITNGIQKWLLKNGWSLPKGD